MSRKLYGTLNKSIASKDGWNVYKYIGSKNPELCAMYNEDQTVNVTSVSAIETPKSVELGTYVGHVNSTKSAKGQIDSLRRLGVKLERQQKSRAARMRSEIHLAQAKDSSELSPNPKKGKVSV